MIFVQDSLQQRRSLTRYLYWRSLKKKTFPYAPRGFRIARQKRVWNSLVKRSAISFKIISHIIVLDYTKLKTVLYYDVYGVYFHTRYYLYDKDEVMYSCKVHDSRQSVKRDKTWVFSEMSMFRRMFASAEKHISQRESQNIMPLLVIQRKSGSLKARENRFEQIIVSHSRGVTYLLSRYLLYCWLQYWILLRFVKDAISISFVVFECALRQPTDSFISAATSLISVVKLLLIAWFTARSQTVRAYVNAYSW